MIKIAINKQLRSAEGEMKLTINTTIKRGEFIALYGPSGVGKTTLLRIMAGLTPADSGFIEVGEHKWFDAEKGIVLPPQKRSVGLVFQDYALFPNMSVEQNIRFAAHKSVDVKALMQEMDLSAIANQSAQKLSGGQQQRVALARTVATKPDVLLLDEALSALDHAMRQQLQDHLQKVHREFGLTTIMVSHDLGDIYRLCDRVLQLKEGKLIADGSPAQVFTNQQLSGKFKFTGEVLKIEKQEVVYVVTVLVHQDIIKVVAQEDEIAMLSIGDRVMIASKAFNPVILGLGRKA